MKMPKIISKLFQPKNRMELEALDKIMTLAVPFNAPHMFKLLKVTPSEVQIKLPCMVMNKNHVGGVHAAAMVTLGEYCAGMVLASRLGTEKYRLVLADLSAKYFYQGKKTLIGTCHLDETLLKPLEAQLALEDGKGLISLVTFIKDTDDKDIAEVKTTWQMKVWEKVKTK